MFHVNYKNNLLFINICDILEFNGLMTNLNVNEKKRIKFFESLIKNEQEEIRSVYQQQNKNDQSNIAENSNL